MSGEDDDPPRPPADLLDSEFDLDGLEDALNGDNFRAWRREQKFRENIKNDNPEYNGGGYKKTPKRHSPHTLNQCRRKQWYREHNAIEETAPVDGIFTIGSYIEEEIIEPWLDALAEQFGGYLANGLWLEGTIDTETGKLTIAGKTDPAVVDRDGVPYAITEVKSKASLSNLNSPNPHHKSQLLSYLHNAKQEYDLDDYPAGYFIYSGKKRLDVRVFKVEFDEDFFRKNVVEWCENLTFCRIEDMLPKAKPEQSWECNLCEYRGRCGNYDPDPDERDLAWEDCGADGMLPLFDYPVESVIEYMHANAEAKLTPTVAHKHPELTEVFDVYDWECPRCTETFAWTEFSQWDGDVESPPFCPQCAEDDFWIDLSGPDPDDQTTG